MRFRPSIFIFVLLATICFFTGCQKPNEDLNDFRLAALVGDERLSQDDLFEALGIERAEVPEHFALYLQALDDYINFILIRKEAERLKIPVTRDMLNEALEAEIIKAGSEAALNQKLQREHKTRKYLVDALTAEISANIIVTRYPEELKDENTTADEIPLSFDNYILKYFQVKSGAGKSSDATLATAQELSKYAESGVSMETLTKISDAELVEIQIQVQNGRFVLSSLPAFLTSIVEDTPQAGVFNKVVKMTDGAVVVQITPSQDFLQNRNHERRIREQNRLRQGRTQLIEKLRRENFVEIFEQPVMPKDKLPEIRY